MRLVFALLLVVLFQQTPDFVGLHSHNGVLLRVEVGTPIIDFHADQVLVQLFAIAEEGLFRNELKKPAFLRRASKVFALENSAEFLPLLEKRGGKSNRVGQGRHRSSRP